jgi:hypothetical protein
MSEPNFKEAPTYVTEVALAGANNKDMLSMMNPSGSGVVIRVYEVWATVPSSSGATVIVPFEIRRATAVTTGSTLTAVPLDTTNASAQAVIRQAPTGISDASAALFWTFVEQINTAQASTDAMTHSTGDLSGNAQAQPITLREGEGIYLRQIASNTSTFRMGVLWTEDNR